MPEWDTQPANHYLPRKITEASGKRQDEFHLGDFLQVRAAPSNARQATESLT
jgi:hypothetical protein